MSTGKPAGLQITERAFQSQVRQLAATLGWRVYCAWLSIRSPKGYPDLTCVHETQQRVLWLEIKSESGKPTAAQLSWNATLVAAGQEAHIVRPSDWDFIVGTLRPQTIRKEKEK